MDGNITPLLMEKIIEGRQLCAYSVKKDRENFTK